MIKKFKFPILIGLIFIVLGIITPDLAKSAFNASKDYFKEMALIMPPVFILMGLMEVWVSKDKIEKWLGDKSGFRGGLVALGLGTLPTGPLYVAFPMTATLLRKGASIRNMIIFLGAWAALKIPQLMVEIKFLGISFTALRFVLTLIFLTVMGEIIERSIGHESINQWLPPKDKEALENHND
jgi:uncharacterized membrane protein YraQ (UPF0718 family)